MLVRPRVRSPQEPRRRHARGARAKLALSRHDSDLSFAAARSASSSFVEAGTRTTSVPYTVMATVYTPVVTE